ncbi:MAG TPA: DUF4097 family beta strand repeat-containing protein [Clostridiales bacterium]|nr:DUF4097 family beta strand repeat-containing protein [Clostridiales bacterium]HQP68838.1 DUF4097 family beta strand repeat-containing protein [Clostridiales bacterium]
MNIKRIVSVMIPVVIAAGLYATDYTTQTGGGIKKITLDNQSIRQITCEGKNLNASVIGTKNKAIELYFSKKSMTEDQLRSAELKADENSKPDAKVTIINKELKIGLEKKSGDGEYLTIFTPANVSVIVTLDNGDLNVKDIKGELLLNGKNMDTDISRVSGVINYRSKSGDLNVEDFEGVLDIRTFSGDINLKKITGSVKADNKSGEFDLSGFNGKLSGSFQVGDVKISSSTVTWVDIVNQSGEVKISDLKGDRIKVKSSLGGIDISNSKLDMINVELNAGDLEISGSEADLNLEVNMGEIELSNHRIAGKTDSDIKVSFGDIEVGLKDPASYDYYVSVNDEKADYKSGMDFDSDIRICNKNKKCLRISKSMGSITVK